MENLSLLYPGGYSEEKRAFYRMKNYDFVKELQLESLIILVKDGYRYCGTGWILWRIY